MFKPALYLGSAATHRHHHELAAALIGRQLITVRPATRPREALEQAWFRLERSNTGSRTAARRDGLLRASHGPFMILDVIDPIDSAELDVVDKPVGDMSTTVEPTCDLRVSA